MTDPLSREQAIREQAEAIVDSWWLDDRDARALESDHYDALVDAIYVAMLDHLRAEGQPPLASTVLGEFEGRIRAYEELLDKWRASYVLGPEEEAEADALRRAEGQERDKAEAVLEAIDMVLRGDHVSDFMQSHEPVRRVMDLIDANVALVNHQKKATAAELLNIASWVRTPGNINIDDARDEIARVLENRAHALEKEAR